MCPSICGELGRVDISPVLWQWWHNIGINSVIAEGRRLSDEEAVVFGGWSLLVVLLVNK